MANDVPQRLEGQGEIANRQAVIVEQPRQEEAARDLKLLVLAVARDLDHLEPFQERIRDEIEMVGAQEQHGAREVDRKTQVMVGEADAALRIQQLEQQLHHSETALAREPVDAVDDHHRIADACLAQRAHDLAGLGAGKRAAHATQLAGIGGARDADAHVRAVQGSRHGGAERGLAGAGRADEAQCGAWEIGLELAHREVLDDALLGLRQAEMLALEDLLDPAQVGVLAGGALPRKRPQPLEIGPHLRGLGRSRR